MSNRMILFLIAVAVVAICVLFAYNFMHMMDKGGGKPEVELGLNTIRGMEVYRDEIPYTLNFRQQIASANYLGEAEIAEEYSGSAQKGSPLPVEKIVVYRFPPLPDLEITPLETRGEELLFATDAPGGQGPFIEKSDGKLMELLAESTR